MSKKQECKKCGGELKPGIAAQSGVVGMPDFPGDTQAVTLSAGGPGKIVKVWKCQECGWSMTK